MRYKLEKIAFALFVLVLTIVLVSSDSSIASTSSSFASSQSYVGSASYVSQQYYQPNFQTYYSQDQINSYWPILNGQGNGSCQGRQDILLNIAPAGCQPAVVRSDLLAEQNVPVFCQIDAMVLNPLINVKEISNLRFTGTYPKEIAGTGFHPALAALNTQDTLAGSPSINNIGYVVVLVKQNPVEKSLPDSVNVTLAAHIEYTAGNALGIGQAEFVLSPSNDAQWATDKLKQSFWQGRYFVRLEDMDAQSAVVSLYSEDQKITTLKVNIGQPSAEIPVLGSYCMATLQIVYEDAELPKPSATIEVSDDKGTDSFKVYSGSTFLNGKCRVTDLQISGDNTGSIVLNCLSTGNSLYSKPFALSLNPRYSNVLFNDVGKQVSIVAEGNSYTADFGITLGKYGIDANNNFYLVSGSAVKDEATIRKEANGNQTKLAWLDKVKKSLIDYKSYSLANPGQSAPMLVDRQLSPDLESKFKAAVDAYNNVAVSYPSETVTAVGRTYGEQALENAISLAKVFGKDLSRKTLMEEFIKAYPDSNLVSGYKSDLASIYSVDGSNSAMVLNIDNIDKTVSVVGFDDSKSSASASVSLLGYPSPITVYANRTVLGGSQNANPILTLNVPYTSNAGQISILSNNVQTGLSISGNNLMYNGNTVGTFTKNANTGGGKLVFSGSSVPAGLDNQIYILLNGATLVQNSNLISLANGVSQNSQGGVIRDLTLDYVDKTSARITASCLSSANNGGNSYTSQQVILTVGGAFTSICNTERIKLNGSPNVNQVARIQIIPNVKNTGTDTNLSVKIGIEKRAIQLSPNETMEKIKNLNESIDKWTKISDSLSKVVSGLKGACFATAAILTAKNFLSGLSGEATARQNAMKGKGGWDSICQDMIAKKTPGSTGTVYETLTQCYNGESANIQKDVDAWTKAIDQTNTKINSIESSPSVQYGDNGLSGFFGGKNINQDAAKKQLADSIKSDCSGSRSVSVNGWVGDSSKKQVGVSDMIGDINSVSYDDLRTIYTDCLLNKNGGSTRLSTSTSSSLSDVANRISSNLVVSKAVASNVAASSTGEPGATVITPKAKTNINAQVVPKGNVKTSGADALKSYFETVVIVPQTSADSKAGTKDFPGGKYLLGLSKPQADGSTYVIQEALYFDPSSNAYKSLPNSNTAGDFQNAYGIGTISSVSSKSYVNKYYNPQVRYFENDPYKGMPALVPFDLQQGWYAATQQTLPGVAGGIKSFDASGKVASFWMCNVGPNGREEFEQGLGDDICEQFNLNTGQSTQDFPGLDSATTKALVGRAITALDAAAKSYSSGVKNINIPGVGALAVGNPSTGTPSAQCQDFMSSDDCKLLFNVCDPVICPASRCNLGGAYPVADVVQTGIVGSALLCLPNFKEGVYIPVCLTGIQAGIDAYVSVLKNHRDCLQASLDTGQMIGICDQIYSVYLCEFFWGQVAPVVNILLPKLIEYAYTGGQTQARGGGEYLTVMGAWQNMRNSIDYFTQSYAANSFKAFQAKSIEEAGGEFCKSFVSAAAPSVKSLLQPDSPPQFYAYFGSTSFTTATVPATSEYKVFYHIFAGKDAGVYFSVYLKSPVGTSYYSTNPTVQVASGFIVQGDYKSETKDFTAPEGYKELCVRINDQESCGFKQVGTDFAVNYLADSAMANQINQTGITSSTQCTSGTPSVSGALGSAVSNPGLGSAMNEIANPEIYNRGIIRICATSNPGSTTDPTRYVDMGYCDNPKVRCWIDKQSVNNAISANDVGIKNSTLSSLQGISLSQIDQSGLLSQGDGASVLDSFQTRLDALGSATSANIESLSTPLLSDMDAVKDKLFWNNQKASLLYMKGQVYEVVAKKFLDSYLQTLAVNQANTILANGVSAAGQLATNVANSVSNAISGTLNPSYILNNSYNSAIPISILKNGVDTGIYLMGTKVMLKSTSIWPWSTDSTIGTVSGNKISISDSSKSSIPSDLYMILNGATLASGGTSITSVSTGNTISNAGGSSANTASGAQSLSSNQYALERDYSSTDSVPNHIQTGGESLYLSGGNLYLQSGTSASSSNDEIAGSVSNGNIIQISGTIDTFISSFDKATISGKIITLASASANTGGSSANAPPIQSTTPQTSIPSSQSSVIAPVKGTTAYYNKCGANLVFDLQNGYVGRRDVLYRFNGVNWEFTNSASPNNWLDVAKASLNNVPSSEDFPIVNSLKGKSFSNGFASLLYATMYYSTGLLNSEPQIITKGISFEQSYIKNGWGDNFQAAASEDGTSSNLLGLVLKSNGLCQ